MENLDIPNYYLGTIFNFRFILIKFAFDIKNLEVYSFVFNDRKGTYYEAKCFNFFNVGLLVFKSEKYKLVSGKK